MATARQAAGRGTATARRRGPGARPGRVADPLAAARALAPRIRAAAAQTERERALPPDLVAEMRAAGLFHLLIPRSLGGLEADPVTASRVVEEVAAADGSAGWCVMLAGQSAAFAGFLSAERGREIWGRRGVVAGTARPIGRAVPTRRPQPGYMVDGRWPFASGSSHADWFAGECTIYARADAREPRRDRAGNPVTRMLFFPRSQVTSYDTWNTTGLRGTASNDFSVSGAFVPADRGFQVMVSPPLHRWALYRAEPAVFANHGAHALGVARAAIAEARQIAATKPGWGTYRPLRELPRIQSVIAQSTALVESARSYLYAAVGALWEGALAGVEGEEKALLRARSRLATSHAATSSVRAVDLVHAAMGATPIFAASPLERQFRDIHTAAAHVMIGPLTYEAAGRVELGLEAGFPFF